MHLLDEVAQVLHQIPRLDVALGIAGRSDADGLLLALGDLAHQPDQLARVLQSSVDGNERWLPARRVASQRQDVVDPGVEDFLDGLGKLVPRRADAGDVRHRFDLEFLLDPSHHLQRAAARRAARAPGHADEGRPERAERAYRLEEGLDPRLRLGREELEGEERLPALAAEA